jgi:hypothetical protein
VLEEAGLSADDIASLAAEGVVEIAEA